MAVLEVFYFLIAVTGTYFGGLTILMNGWAQRQAIYLHKVQTIWYQDPNEPEIFGYLKNQVRPFHIRTPDGETLYGWHVLPLHLYQKYESTLMQEETTADFDDSFALRLLMDNPDSKLVINFHGNAGTVTQGWRTDTYRSLTSVADNVHLITIDYRGFGYSTGKPNEAGLILDGVTVVKWAVQKLQIAPERIVLVGQSLGTAVAVAVAEALAPDIDIKNIVLIAAFSDMPSLLLDYKAGGFIPILAPLKPWSRLARFYMDQVQETWDTRGRLEKLFRARQLNLWLVHAKDDREIPWQNSEILFHTAMNASLPGTSGSVHLEIVPFGGHNRVATYPVVAKAVGALIGPGTA